MTRFRTVFVLLSALGCSEPDDNRQWLSVDDDDSWSDDDDSAADDDDSAADDDDADGTDPETGCDCTASAAGDEPAGLGFLLLLALFAGRRIRRR